MTRLFWIRLLGALLLLTLLGAAIAPLSVFAEDPLTVTGGKVCSLTEPLGIEGTPVFSWTATSTKRDDGQSTYRIVLAKTKKDAENAENLVWDSGEVASSSMLDIPYTGKALDSRTSYYWRVTIKSRKGDTAKSEVFRFSTGVESTAWTGDWIGMPSPKPTLSLSGTQWIWLASGASFSGVPAGSEYFRFSFDIPADKTPEAFEIAYTADDSAEVFLNGTKVSEMSLWSDGSFYQGTELLVSGKNTVAIAATNASAGYAGLCARLKVSYTDGTADIYTTNKTAWKVSKTAPSNWKLASFDDSAWSAPDQAVTFGSSPWGTGVTLRGESSRAAVYLRREFTLDKEIKEALVSLCGLGFFDLTVNGKSPDDSVLNPFTTQYDVAVYYRTFDLTSLLKKGDNAIAVELGNSYYNEIGGVWNWASAAWRDDPKLMLRLDIRYADGTSDVIVSDTDWKATNQGPITANSMYYGDVYDARLAMDGFNQAGFDDSAWQAAAVMAKPLGKLESQMKAPVSRVASFAPAEIVKLGDGSWRVESPEMVAGWVLLKNIDQKAGDKITLTYGQKLNADGTVLKYGSVDGELASWYPHAYFQQDIYYSAGGNKESYEPKFSYKGFEYVQIDGYDGELTADDVVIYRVSNDVEIISEFSSSNELFNQLHHCMVVALADNFQGEHCDPMLEKNGWLGDANVSLTSMSFNFDMAATLPGFLELMEDTQEKYGFVPQMVPAANWGIQNTAVWNTVFIYGAEELEKYFGTLSYSEAQYDAMRKMAVRDINEMKANNWVWHDNQLADWVAPIGGSNPNVAYNENMSEGSGIVGTAFVYGTLSYMKALAERMGKTADAKEYADAMTKIYTAFNKKFYNEAKGYYETKTWSQIGTRTKYRQTSNLVPLAFGLVPEEHIDSVVKSIVEDIKDKNYHLDTGCVGTRYILPILCDYGYSDVAYRVATQTTYPSWGFWIENGAKSTWEMWESTTRSFDHYFLGTYEEWFFSHLGGIKQVENGYESFVIEPSFIGDLTEVNTRVNTVRGELVSAWKVSDTGVVELTVTVPFGSTAKVLLPCADTADVTIGGNPVTLSVDGVHSVSDQGDTVAITVGSGTYVFAVKADKVGMTVYRDSLDAALLQLKLYLDDNAFLSERAAMTALWEKSLAVYQDENATQLAVNAAAEEIEAYLTHLVGSESRNALRDAIETSKTKYPRVLYPEEAYATYRAALRDAEAKAADHSLHDDALEAALAALLAAEQTLDAARYPNLALQATPSASSTHEDSYWKWGLALVNDGNRANSGPQAGEYTGYCSSQTPAVDHAEWLMLDLGSLQTVNTVVIYSGATFDGERWLCYGFPDSYSIEVSTDKKTWKTVYQENSAELAEYGAFVYAFEDVEARYIRLNATSLRPKVSDSNSYRLQISEFEVYAVRELSSVDTEAVRNAIVSGEALLTDACYLGATADAKASYQLALDTLKELYADANALPSEAEAAIEALALAKTQLETNRAPIDTTPDTTEKDPDVTTPVTTDGGNDPIDPNDPDDPDDTPSVGLIIGILVGVLVIAGVAVGILLWKKKKSAQ